MSRRGVQFNSSDFLRLEEEAQLKGFESVSDYILFLAEKDSTRRKPIEARKKIKESQIKEAKQYFSTSRGKMFHGDSLAWMAKQVKPKSIDLIMTSPPFGLLTKKTYGNEEADQYCDWFRPFAELFQRVLKDNGSVVIDFGGAWNRGQPTRNLYHFDVLHMLCREYGFFLCQEFYWWNPAKLPTPAEWVTVRKVRVKDAVNCIWWLSKTPFPKVAIGRALTPYSESMFDLMKNGYTANKRPSGHDISEKFGVDNGGAIPPNLIAVANTSSTDSFQKHCRDNGIAIHPARFPLAIPELFIRMLTDRRDIVLDPFAGSCTTGLAAQNLGRRWVCVEKDKNFLKGGKLRFDSRFRVLPPHKRKKAYLIHPPNSLDIDETKAPIIADGGRAKPAKINVK